MGSKRTWMDGRARVFLTVISWILHLAQRPGKMFTFFVLENVCGMKAGRCTLVFTSGFQVLPCAGLRVRPRGQPKASSTRLCPNKVLQILRWVAKRQIGFEAASVRAFDPATAAKRDATWRKTAPPQGPPKIWSEVATRGHLGEATPRSFEFLVHPSTDVQLRQHSTIETSVAYRRLSRRRSPSRQATCSVADDSVQHRAAKFALLTTTLCANPQG